MAKPGLRFGTLHQLVKFGDNGPGWSLCIGAGTSMHVFPGWRELVRALISRAPDPSNDLAERLLSAFSPDALIEAATRRLKAADFGATLSECLYSDLKNQARSSWPAVVACLEAEAIARLGKPIWTEFLDLFERHPELSRTSALQIARSLVRTLGTERAPASILSFNAEPLLFALVNAYVARSSPAPAAADRHGPPGRRGGQSHFLSREHAHSLLLLSRAPASP